MRRKKKISTDQSILNEPHLNGQDCEMDISELYADIDLAVSKGGRTEREDVEQGVWDEPGLSKELAGKKPDSVMDYCKWLERGWYGTSVVKSFGIMILIMLLSGPWAIFTAMIINTAKSYGWGGAMVIVVFGPVCEEMMKVGIALLVVEKVPYWFKYSWQILFCALAGGLLFAVIENLYYLNVLIPNASEQIVHWRWTICVVLHVGCSSIAGWGVRNIWLGVWHSRKPAEISKGFKWLAGAMILHGCYNGGALILEAFGFFE